MGREVRRVPPDWQHPRDEKGQYIPLYDGKDFLKELSDYDFYAEAWENGMTADYGGEPRALKPKRRRDTGTYEDYAGARPEPKDYMPQWRDEERTHIQMYQTTSEGTPISPVMANPEELARWLADTGASAFAGMPATYEQWLATINAWWAPSMVLSKSGAMSGVAFSVEDKKRS